jgi:uncharacterized membrane protein
MRRMSEGENELLQERPFLRFNIRADFSLYVGLAFLFVSFILLLGVVVVWLSSKSGDGGSITSGMLVFMAPLPVFFSDRFVLFTSRIIGQTKSGPLGKNKNGD